MATSWKAQQDLKTGKYYLQFETDCKEKYKQVEKLCQRLIDVSNEITCEPVNWFALGHELLNNNNDLVPDACRTCTNHPSNGGSGLCNCTLGLPKITY